MRETTCPLRAQAANCWKPTAASNAPAFRACVSRSSYTRANRSRLSRSSSFSPAISPSAARSLANDSTDFAAMRDPVAVSASSSDTRARRVSRSSL